MKSNMNDIERNRNLKDNAEIWIDFCLNNLQFAANEMGIDKLFSMNVGTRLTIEEITGTLIAAEQKIKELKSISREYEEG